MSAPFWNPRPSDPPAPTPATPAAFSLGPPPTNPRFEAAPPAAKLEAGTEFRRLGPCPTNPRFDAERRPER